jgi:hypothetical protein
MHTKMYVRYNYNFLCSLFIVEVIIFHVLLNNYEYKHGIAKLGIN